jgi:hypothetical protein
MLVAATSTQMAYYFVHLIYQVRKHCGIADKNMIEKAHQPWKHEKEQTLECKEFQATAKVSVEGYLQAITLQNPINTQTICKQASKQRCTFKSSDNNPTTKTEVKAGLIRQAKVEKHQAFVALNLPVVMGDL